MRGKFLSILILILMCICPKSASGTQQSNNDWNKFINAIIYVESRGNTNLAHHGCYGAMQITRDAIDEVNKICKKKGWNKRFTLSDCYGSKKSLEVSKEVFNILQDYYNPSHDFRKATNLWNGGFVWKNNAHTRMYYKLVMDAYYGRNKKEK